MDNKLLIIKHILATDEETDRKILSMLEAQEDESKAKVKKIHIEDREGGRKDVTIDVDLNTGKEKILATAENISPGGVFIRTNQKIDKGEDIAIRFAGPEDEHFVFVAEVVRVDEDGIGVRIKTMSDQVKSRFIGFVNQI